MSLKTTRILAAAYFVAMLVFLTWPGTLPFARATPFVLGLPFTFAWAALWVIGVMAVLWGVDQVERRHRDPSEEE